MSRNLLGIKGVTTGIFRRLLRGHEEWAPQIVRRALMEVGQLWRDEDLPDHFETSAYSRYGGVFKYKVTARSRLGVQSSHRLARKSRRTEPMTDTGRFRYQILRGALRYRVYKSNGRIQVDVKLPYVGPENFWTGGRRRHDFAAMLRAMTAGQRRKIRDFCRGRTLELLRERLTLSRFVGGLNASGFRSEMSVHV